MKILKRNNEHEIQILNILQNSVEDLFIVNDGSFSYDFFAKLIKRFNVSINIDDDIIRIFRKDSDECLRIQNFIRLSLLQVDELVIQAKFITPNFLKDLKKTFKIQTEPFYGYVKIKKVKNKLAFLFNYT